MMKKKLSILLAATIVATSLCSSFSFASAHKADLSETRYRYPILNLDNVNFTTGKPIETISKTKSYLSHDGGAGKNKPDGLFYATIEKYPHLDTGNNANKALVIKYPGTDLLAQETFVGYKFNMVNKDKDVKAGIGPSNGPLKDLPGIPENSNENGIMVHVEIANLDGDQTKGFQYIQEQTETQEKYETVHQGLDFNITWQELDYDSNGQPIYEKEDPSIQSQTAYNVGKGNDITYIWTKNVEAKFKRGEYDANGNPVKEKNDKGEEVDKLKEVSINKKIGDVDVIKSGGEDGKQGGTIVLPGAFCGYVLIPFSSFNHAWDSENANGLIDFKIMQLVNIYTSAYQRYRGLKIFDDYNFYGPAFKGLEGAVDMGASISNVNFKIAPGTSKPDDGKPSEKPLDGVSTTENSTTENSTTGNSTTGNSAAGNSAAGNPAAGNPTTGNPTTGNSAAGNPTGVSVSEESSAKESSIVGVNESNDNKSGDLTWLWILIAVIVVLCGGGVGAFFYIKKRKSDLLTDQEIDLESDSDSTDISDSENKDSEDK